MLNLSKVLLVTVFSTLSLASVNAQNKAPDLTDQDDRVVNLREPTKNPDDRSQGGKRNGNAAVNRLRCWQHGRLIFDKRNIRSMPRSERVIELRSAGERPQTTQIMDMSNGFCILENATR
jgi:hypothetical protein